VERQPEQRDESPAPVVHDATNPSQGASTRPSRALGATALARALDRKPAEVAIRKRPTQARGAATFDAILDAAATLLEEGGYEILTTNLVAEIAGINIATLYQYFPSKEAILLALFRRDTDVRTAAGTEPLQRSSDSSDWRTVLHQGIDILVEQRRRQPGAGALRRAMRSLPELQAYERETMVVRARAVAASVARRKDMDPERANRIGLCVVETTAALLDVWSLGDASGLARDDDAIIDELKAMVMAYLAPHLDEIAVGDGVDPR